AEGLHRRKTGVYLLTLFFVTLSLLLYATTRPEVPMAVVFKFASVREAAKAAGQSLGESVNQAQVAADDTMRALPDAEWRRDAFDGSHYTFRRRPFSRASAFPL